MSYLDVPTYRLRERSWRARAAELPSGRERDACTALADGYTYLVALLETLEATNRQKVHSVAPDRVGNGAAPGGRAL
jgi:hypothetical protein